MTDTRQATGSALIGGITETLGVTRAQLADGAGVRRGRVSEVASGRRPARVEEVIAWLDAHSSSAAVVLTRSGVSVVDGPIAALPAGTRVL